uniref:Uncharacterized protein n=1 Tax=Aegilops tauschii subsp. strangulata TaxID=200361 RepID=A0A453MXQ1_AEGTS
PTPDPASRPLSFLGRRHHTAAPSHARRCPAPFPQDSLPSPPQSPAFPQRPAWRHCLRCSPRPDARPALAPSVARSRIHAWYFTRTTEAPRDHRLHDGDRRGRDGGREGRAPLLPQCPRWPRVRRKRRVPGRRILP